MTRNEVFFRIGQAKDGEVPGLGRGATCVMIVPKEMPIPTQSDVKKAIEASKQTVVVVNDCYCMGLIGATEEKIEFFVNTTFNESKAKGVWGVFFG